MSSLLPEGAGIVVGVGVGAAASAAIEPAVEIPKQEAWARNQNRLLAAQMMAALVAQGALELPTGQSSANREGYTSEKFDHLVYLAQTAPGASEALEQWRKGFISTDLYAHALTKAARDQRYVFTSDAYRLKELVGLGDVAYGVVRGILPAPAWLPVAPPASGDKVPRFPQVEIDPLDLAHRLGFNEDMLKLMVGRSGLSMAPGLAAQAFFRTIIGPNDYLLAIAEGDLRTEWAEAMLDVSRQILTAGEYAELQLRGFIDEPTRRSKTAQHGMSTADSDLLYDLLGRGVNVHQVLIGERRGGTFNGPTDQIPPEYLAALRRGNLRPEFYNLAYAARETFPSYFVTRSLLQSGAITSARGAELFAGLGWPLDVADAAATLFGGGTTATADPHVTKAENQLWTTLHRSYVAEETDDATATTALDTIGVAASAVPQILALWEQERALIRKQLTPAQIKKAYKGLVLNPATGVAWTLDDALAALIARGYSMNDATTFLEL